MHKIFRNMQWKRINMPRLHRYAPNLKYYATVTRTYQYMQLELENICNNMQEYARICIGAYVAYFAYICNPHFDDVARELPSQVELRRQPPAAAGASTAGGVPRTAMAVFMRDQPQTCFPAVSDSDALARRQTWNFVPARVCHQPTACRSRQSQSRVGKSEMKSTSFLLSICSAASAFKISFPCDLAYISRSVTSRNLFSTQSIVMQQSDSHKKRVVFCGTPDVAASSLRRIFQKSKNAGLNRNRSPLYHLRCKVFDIGLSTFSRFHFRHHCCHIQSSSADWAKDDYDCENPVQSNLHLDCFQ
jgi:hypothetical protein